jgi:GNAT superfamily N-acetyltransferase
MLIQLTASNAQILACFPVMVQLRPHLNQDNFLAQIRRQKQSGYQLVYLTIDAHVLAVAGFSISECFAWGHFLYVYDLVVDQAARSQGYGQHLFAWLVDFARQHNCQQLHLDSGVQRFDAHRFYFQQRITISSHHFSLSL